MSSFTISITVCGLDHPCSAATGLYTRTFGVPVTNRRANSRCAMPAP